MKKVSKFTLCGIIALLVLLLIIQGVTLRDTQGELETAELKYNDLEKNYNTLQKDYNDLANNCNDLVNSLSLLTSSSNQENPAKTELPPNQSDNYYDSTALANKALMHYIAGEWDGTPTIIDEQLISLNDDGELLINNHDATPSSFCYSHSIDLPDETGNVITQVFILGDGTYRLENNRIVKYSKGKEVKLSGGTLDWSGMDIENYRPFDTEFCYDEINDKLYLIASSVPYDFSNKELKDNVGVYLYLIPDRSKSELEFISQIKYTKEEADYIFDKSTNPIIRYFLYMEHIMEFETDWWFTFADGYIHARDAFPDGTFSHPVTTTPGVSLSAYEW